ncbi:hypothetical protein ACHAXA_007038 [Cyclostephanos tholiformis]|uniref:Mannosyltransferase n=1 Tax=Cyclostephanos tholiformis TaxID=382380 RepID=A0ABD3RBN2_9STRA
MRAPRERNPRIDTLPTQPSRAVKGRKQYVAKGSMEEKEGDDDGLYKVEKIVDHWSDKRGVLLYRTRWMGYTAKDDTWEPAENVSSTGHIDRYERLLRRKRKKIKEGSAGVAVIEYEDGEREMVDMEGEIFRRYHEESDGEDDGNDDTADGDVDGNDYGLIVQGEWIEILWRHANIYFPCKIISWTPVASSTAKKRIGAMEANEICELTAMTHQRGRLGRWVIYILLLLIRFLGVFQRGYVHPDEFFQGGQELFFGHRRNESDVGYLTRDYVVKNVPWEFESRHAVRSIVPPTFMTLLPLRMYTMLRHMFSTDFLTECQKSIRGSTSSLWMTSPAMENLSGIEILLVPRLFMALMSVIFLDGSLWLLLLISHRRTVQGCGPPIEVVVLASSWPCLVFSSRPFTNSLEAMVLAFLLVIVAATAECSETNYLKDKINTKKKNDDACLSLILIGAISSVGIFVRFTFAFFAFPVVALFLMHRWKSIGGYRSKCLVHYGVPLSFSFLLVSFAFVWVDNRYYSWQNKLDCDIKICEGGAEFSCSSILDYIAPFNALRYNSNRANLAEHGLHPRFTHLVINMPMLFGPLAIAGFGSFIVNVNDAVAGKGTSYSFTKSICQLAILSGVLILSFAPHQEPRFLIPSMVPLVFLWGRQVVGEGVLETSNALKRRSKLSRLLLVLWVLFNTIPYIFFGWLHQGGLIQSLLRLENSGRIIRIKSDAPLPQAIIYYKTYMPPTFLTREGPRIKRENEACDVAGRQCSEEKCMNTKEREVILDLQRADSSILLKVFRTWLPCNDQDVADSDTSLQLVSPPAVILPLATINSGEEWSKYSILSLKDYHGHISTEDWPKFDSSVITFLDQLKVEVYTVTCSRS